MKPDPTPEPQKCWAIRVTDTNMILHRGPIQIDGGALLLTDEAGHLLQAFGVNGWLSVEPTDD